MKLEVHPISLKSVIPTVPQDEKEKEMLVRTSPRWDARVCSLNPGV